LLEADLSEIQATADRTVAEHVAACSACAARAARIVGDSAWLTRAIPAAPTPSRWRRSTYVATALVAASILLLLLTRVPRAERRTTPPVLRTAVTSTSTGVATSDAKVGRDGPGGSPNVDLVPAPHRAAGSSAIRRLGSATAVAPLAIVAESTPAVPTRAVRLDSPDAGEPAAVDARPSLAVDVVPSSGRYAVLRSTPEVTVVWFY